MYSGGHKKIIVNLINIQKLTTKYTKIYQNKKSSSVLEVVPF